jgi:hypothetical protein
MQNNPFSAMTFIVAPAILTNAMSVLALGSGNRLARAVDRFRETQKEIERAGGTVDPARARRLERLRNRARCLLGAMQAFFRALGSFAGTTLVAVLGTALSGLGYARLSSAAALLGLAVGTFGLLNLLWGCVLVVRDTRLAVAGLDEEAAVPAGKE